MSRNRILCFLTIYDLFEDNWDQSRIAVVNNWGFVIIYEETWSLDLSAQLNIQKPTPTSSYLYRFFITLVLEVKCCIIVIGMRNRIEKMIQILTEIICFLLLILGKAWVCFSLNTVLSLVILTKYFVTGIPWGGQKNQCASQHLMKLYF